MTQIYPSLLFTGLFQLRFQLAKEKNKKKVYIKNTRNIKMKIISQRRDEERDFIDFVIILGWEILTYP